VSQRRLERNHDGFRSELAFLAHKVLEFGDRLYQQCWEGESRHGLWTLLRSAFYYVAVESWEGLPRYHLSDEARSP